jgi:hypothetical protein
MLGSITLYTDHLRVIRTSDDDHMSIRFRCPCRELLHSRNEGTGSVNDLRRPLLEFFLDLWSYPMSTDHCRFASLDLNRLSDGRHAFFTEAMHLLLIVDQRPKRPHCIAFANRVLDHIDRPLNAEAKPVFVCKKNLHHGNCIKFPDGLTQEWI